MPDADHYTWRPAWPNWRRRSSATSTWFYPIYSMKSFTYNNGRKTIAQPNRNLLLYRDALSTG